MTNDTLAATDTVVTTESVEAVVRDWLSRFEGAVVQSNVPAAMDLMSESPMWRDVYALTWDLTPARGREEVSRFLGDYLQARTLGALELDPQLPVSVDDDGVILAMFSFRTDITTGVGVLRLVKENGRFLAWTISTELRDLVDHPKPVVTIGDAAREEYNVLLADSSVGQHREPSDFVDHDPEVLIIGAGQAGLILAARLAEEGLETLVVDKYERAGDSWRQRYDNLRLHDSKWYSQLPYLPFPPSWPLFSTKDGIADWLELFVEAMGINLWTESPAVSAAYDEAAGRWDVTVRRQGEDRTLRPRHVVFATGYNRLAAMPTVPGAEDFNGVIVHSSKYRGSQHFAGKKVLVVGTGSSGMDIAKSAVEGGADVTMLQRGPTYIMSTRHGVPATWGALFSETSPPQEIADTLAASLPISYMLEKMAPELVRAVAEQDREMLDGLEAAGFHTSLGPGDAGILYLSTAKGGSYYIDNGAAELIIQGKIAVEHGTIDRFTEAGVVLDDGTELELDAVVFATGFANMRESIKPILGEEVADDKVATVWGLDEGGELRTTFRHSGHPRLWIFAGGIQQSRFHSRPVAVMMRAIERGVVSDQISVKLKPSENLLGDFGYRPKGTLLDDE